MNRAFDAGHRTARRLRTIGIQLAEASFAVRLRETRAGLELRATLADRSGFQLSIDITEDGHAELRFWTDPNLNPQRTTAALVKAVEQCRAISPLGHDSPTDFRQRAEHLPQGHPSSPYESDGTPKPQPPDLSACELCLPDE